MKKYISLLAVALFAIGCQKDSIEDINQSSTLYTDSFTINLGTAETRGAFDDELKWSWSNGDEIIGYQNSGENFRNILNYVDGNKFSCSKFGYDTTEPAQFHFIYPAAAEQNDKTLVAVQDGTWNPILVGSTSETTLQEIDNVTMEHLTSALEIRYLKGGNITAAELYATSGAFVGSWTVDSKTLEYNQSLSGKSIIINNLNTTTVVFNMPELDADTFASLGIKLRLTTSSGIEEYTLPSNMTFVKGKRSILNIRVKSALLDKDKFSTNVQNIANNFTGNKTISFITNSNETNGINIEAEGSIPIYLVRNESTIEIHTAAQKIMAPEDSSYLFSSLATVTNINLSGFDTSNVTNMTGMFFMCQMLTSLDLSNFDTSNVETMEGMFYYCPKLTSLDLSNFDTSNVTNMCSMFDYCSALTELNLSNFNTSKVTDMSGMFASCEALTSLNLSNFDTSNVTDMRMMFGYCSNLASLDLSSFTFKNNPKYSDIFSFLGSDLTGDKKTTIWVSNDNKSWFEGKDLGDGNYYFEVK